MRLIDADALLEYARRECSFPGAVMFYQVVNAPTVDAAPVTHGRWCYDGAVSVDAHCWICGEQVPVWMMKYPYCPNCGAKMDLEE